MAKLYNLARMTTATTGSGTVTLGSAVSGRLSFVDAGVQNAETVSYGIKEGNESEVGRGVYGASGSTLTRSVLDSTNSGSLLELGGSAQVFITALAEDLAPDGWQRASETWTYASADDPTYTLTIAGDQTGKYSAGMRVKLTQTTVKYFIITVVAYGAPNTTLTLYGGTDYDLANAAISSNYYSHVKAPFGFPLSPIKWTARVTDANIQTQASPSAATWYNLGSVSLSVPIGEWFLEYKVIAQVAKDSAVAVDVFITLSTANNSESDTEFTHRVYTGVLSSPASIATGVFMKKAVSIAAKTTYYLNTKTADATRDSLYNRGDNGTTIIQAVCAYL